MVMTRMCSFMKYQMDGMQVSEIHACKLIHVIISHGRFRVLWSRQGDDNWFSSYKESIRDPCSMVFILLRHTCHMIGSIAACKYHSVFALYERSIKWNLPDNTMKLDESTARRQLKSPQSLSGRSIPLVTFEAWSSINMFAFRFVAIGPFLAEI